MTTRSIDLLALIPIGPILHCPAQGVAVDSKVPGLGVELEKFRYGKGVAAMVAPKRAPVRPRVVSPDSPGPIPLDDLVSLHLDRGFRGAIEVVGAAGAGKTTALGHLATFPWADRLELVDDAAILNFDSATSADRVVVYTARQTLKRAEVSCRLAGWVDDDWIEYLLSAHPNQCASVMRRLARDGRKSLLGGAPRLCRLVADAMAADESVRDVRGALRQIVDTLLNDRLALRTAGLYSIAMLLDELESAERFARRTGKACAVPWLFELLNNRLVQCLLAADRLFEGLAGGRRRLPTRMLPADVVQETAELAAGDHRALERLVQLLRSRHAAQQPMAASILHLADPGWRPDRHHRILLRGAMLTGAKWLKAYLYKVDLSEADLSDANLQQADLEKAKLEGTILRGSCLRGARLNHVVAWRTDFSDADLTGAWMSGGNLPKAILCDARLDETVAIRAKFPNCRFDRARLRGAKLWECDFLGASFEEANLEGADLTASHLAGVCLRTANLNGATFTSANLSKSDLEFVSVAGAQFQKAELTEAWLTGSVMPSADFRFARLADAALANVDWEGVDLRQADLRGCSFHLGSSRSGLVGSPLAGYGSKTGFYTNDYEEQSYKSPEEIRKANLRGADLRGARIENTDFYLVDLRNAKYDRTQAEHFRRCDAILHDRVE